MQTDIERIFYEEVYGPANQWRHNSLVADIKLESMLHNLIGRCRSTQLGPVSRYQYIMADWIDEFCTVKLKGPRHTGHTAAVLNVAKAYNAIVITQTEILAKEQFRQKGHKKAYGRGQLDTKSPVIRGLNYDVVIIDDFDRNPLTIRERNELEIPSSNGKNETFVMVYVG